jgi:SAM-dependent methyltransferase
MIQQVKAALSGMIPRSVRRAGRDLLDDLCDWADLARGKQVPLDPPDGLVAGIGGSWYVGERFLGHFRELCGLRPDEAVLDVGCGVGRMAVPLAGYLSPHGRYEGFDIIRAHVRWCRRAITPRWPNFRFRHADIFNREYNPDGRLKGSEYRFPYRDRTFDFALLTSVFTHLMPPDAAHYLAELGRVLRPGGRCLATFFLLNAESSAMVDAGRGHFRLWPAEGVYRVYSREVPEACIALDEAFVEESARKAGLAMDRPVRGGWWCGRDPVSEFQDVVIFRQPG